MDLLHVFAYYASRYHVEATCSADFYSVLTVLIFFSFFRSLFSLRWQRSGSWYGSCCTLTSLGENTSSLNLDFSVHSYFCQNLAPIASFWAAVSCLHEYYKVYGETLWVPVFNAAMLCVILLQRLSLHLCAGPSWGLLASYFLCEGLPNLPILPRHSL